MIHHFFFFLYNNGISFTIILVEVEVRTLNVMWQYIEIGAPACPHHRTLSTSCGSQLGYLHPCGSGVRIGATLTRAVAASAYNACRHAGTGQMWAGHAARSFRRVFLQRLVKYFAILLLKKSWNRTSNCNFLYYKDSVTLVNCTIGLQYLKLILKFIAFSPLHLEINPLKTIGFSL